MTFTVVLDVIQRVINIVLGTVGLLLVLRLVLHFFKLPESNPFLRVLAWLTATASGTRPTRSRARCSMPYVSWPWSSARPRIGTPRSLVRSA